MLATAWPDPTIRDVVPSLHSMVVPTLAHFFLFGVLGVLISFNIYYLMGHHYVRTALIVALLTGLIWGLVTEGYQAYVPSRHASVEDVLTDLFGAGCGGLLVAGIYRMIRRPVYRG